MAKNFELKGMKKVLSNLNQQINAIEGRTMKGLIEAAILIRRDMDDTSPKIPIMSGNLRASWFTSTFYTAKREPGLLMGFGANYAVWVHENTGANFRRPGAGAKFFEAALKRNKGKMLKTIQNNAKL